MTRNKYLWSVILNKQQNGKQLFLQRAEACRHQIFENYLLLRDALQKRAPKAVVSPLEGTYLMWVDLGAYVKAGEMADFMEKRCGLAVDYGEWFGGERFGTFIRLNLATSHELAQAAADKLCAALEQC